ncbi:MAG: response regulator transcription factor [Bacteroidales bacterium]|nr:response regulator transcription factor [Bacteroidales bacterium]
MDKIRVFLADDHKLFRDGVRSLLSSSAEFEVVGEASDGLQLMRQISQADPDILITDISMPGLSGIEAVKQILSKKKELNVLILSMFDNEDYVLDSIRAGAKGYLPKDVPAEELFLALKTIAGGKEYFSSTISDIVVKSIIQQARIQSGRSPKLPALTDREVEIVKLIAEGFLSKEIADKLNISIHTVDTHKANIMQKLQLKSSVDIVKYAIRHDMIKL